jgi:hypothetical protein
MDNSNTVSPTESAGQVRGGIRGGWDMFKESISFLFSRPIFLIPLFFAWVCVASITLYLRYYFEGPENALVFFLVIFGIVFLIAFIISIANIMMLELLQQIENSKPVSILRAFHEAIVKDVIKVIPVALLWSVLWFILLIIRALTSRKRGGGRRAEPSMEDAARTLGGANTGPFSWLKLGLRMFEKLIRMFIFLALLPIAWENKGPLDALRTAKNVIGKDPGAFLSTYTLSGVASFIMALPLVPIFMLPEGTELPSIVWSLVILYEGIAWSLTIYLEQMSVAFMYWRHLQTTQQAQANSVSQDTL